MQQMGLNEIRSKFLKFFESKDHYLKESASLVPQNDKSLLLINSGMAPLKNYFAGVEVPPSVRMTTCQKCIRTGDIENVGKTARHGTFFEMLGNFSFGDYFKEQSISWGWEFVTQHLNIPEEKVWVTVYEEDDEAFGIWENQIKIPKERIVRLGKDDNFWEIGIGPCGPCSELYFDRGEEYGCDNPDCKPGCDCDRYLEFWNHVFTQFNRDEEGNYGQLEHKNIDTGMGLERMACIMQGVDTIFDVDTIKHILNTVEKMANVEYGKGGKTDVSIRIITDHIRAVSFLVADGVLPSNEGRGYVLRRLLRRAARHGKLLGIKENFLYKLVDEVIKVSGEAYPELVEKESYIKKVIRIEEEKFNETIEQGMEILASYIADLKKNGETTLSGENAFKLYDTYGFPYELTEEICEEKGVEVSREEFEAKMEEQKEKARAAREVVMEKGQDSFIEEFYDKYGATNFVGYETLKETAKLLSIREGKDGKTLMIFDTTPFYGESGGQTADIGVISGNGFEGKVVDVQKQKGIFTHTVEIVKGEAKEGEEYLLEVDEMNRLATAKNHTATHLLHKALREVLGTHVQQAGSLVNGQRLRFDFNHYEAMTSEEIEKVENLVNEKIAESLCVTVRNMSMDEAKKEGAMALFGDKYGDVVRVVKVDDFSIELCGGTHIDNIAKIGLFKIESESGIAAGVRRIEAVTGLGAYELVKKMERTLKEIAKTVKSDEANVVERVEKMTETLRENSKEIETLKAKITNYEAGSLNAAAEEINGVKVVIKTFKDKTAEELRQMVDSLKDKLGSCVVVLASGEDKAVFAVGVTKDLIGKVKAGNLVKEAAQIAGGNGGGRPDFAQAGGKDASKIEEAVAKVRETLKTLL